MRRIEALIWLMILVYTIWCILRREDYALLFLTIIVLIRLVIWRLKNAH